MLYKYNNIVPPYTYYSLYDDYVIKKNLEQRENPNEKVEIMSKKNFMKVSELLDSTILEELIYHGTKVVIPNLGGLLVVGQGDKEADVVDFESILDKGKYAVKKVRRVNSKATLKNKRELESKGDFTTDPTVYFEKGFFAKFKILYGGNVKTNIKTGQFKLAKLFTQKPSVKFRKILAKHLQDIDIDEFNLKYVSIMRKKLM